MADGFDQEHARRLYEGPTSWNEFRCNGPGLIPLLDCVQLPPPGAATSLDDPYDMSLQNLDLHDARLRGARMEDVNLAGSTFASAGLTGARFAGCSLRGCSFHGARMIDTEFIRCDLGGVDFSFATFGGTRFIGVDLTRPTGYPWAEHVYASVVDTRALELTSASLVQDPSRFAVVCDFLAGLGLPRDLLDVFEVRVMEAGM